MLWTISWILFALWGLGLLSGGTVGAWVHLLLMFSLISLVLAVASAASRRGRALE
jgi:hypothetical protein